MNIRTLVASTALGLATLSLPVQAQHTGHGTHTKAVVSAELSSGEVRTIDLKARKITLKHGELKNLGMPPMTMVFAIKPGIEVPKDLKAGDPVRFRAEESDSALTVTLIQR